MFNSGIFVIVVNKGHNNRLLRFFHAVISLYRVPAVAMPVVSFWQSCRVSYWCIHHDKLNYDFTRPAWLCRTSLPVVSSLSILVSWHAANKVQTPRLGFFVDSLDNKSYKKLYGILTRRNVPDFLQDVSVNFLTTCLIPRPDLYCLSVTQYACGGPFQRRQKNDSIRLHDRPSTTVE